MKSSVDEIRERFDHDVDRFSRLDTGQSSIMDAQLTLELVVEAAAAMNPETKSLLDVGCGAGNYSLKLLQRLSIKKVTLIDLSEPMLERAHERLHSYCSELKTLQGDIRDIDLPDGEFDVIFAAAVLHHLRTDSEWREVFEKFFASLKPGGSVWITDLVDHEQFGVKTLMWERYGEYLLQLGDEEYQRKVFDYIEKEDSPKSLLFQTDLLRQVGFHKIDVLHKNSCFASFGAVKPGT